MRLSYADTNGDGVIADSSFNEGFENGVSNWGGIGSNTQLELDSTIFRSGKYSAKITSPGPDGRYSKCGVWMDINNSQDTYYTYTVYIKSNRPNAEIVLFMKTAEETGFYTSIDSYAYHGYMTQWTKLEKTVLVPANIKKLSLRLDTNADGTVWFDNVSIRRADGQTEIIEETDYYPFGMQHKGLNDIVMSSNLGQKIKYNGKELQDELQLGWYDYHARNYDPSIARWMNIDPLAEQYRKWSPYNYCVNNPMRFTDPDGMGPDDIVIWGSAEYRQTAFNDLQKLTNDKLTISEDGKVTIEQKGSSNSDKTLSVGTDLVSSLIDSPKITTIEQSWGDNSTKAEFGIDGLITKDGPGPGTNSTVKYNPNEKGENIVNADGTKGRPGFIGLGHELGHAKENVTGTRDVKMNPTKIDPDDGTKGTLSESEISVRKVDSQIRKEQGVVERKQPYE